MHVVLMLVLAAPRLAVPDFAGLGLKPELGSFYANEVAREFRRNGVDVTTSADISTLLGLERQRQLMGCEGTGSCMAELGAALGCEAIVTGNLARLDASFRGSLKIVSAKDGRVIAEETFDADGERALLTALEHAARKLALVLVPPPPPPPPVAARTLSWIPLVGAAAAAGGATAALIIANQTYSAIPSSPEPTALRLAADGELAQGVGWALVGVGAAALVGAGLMYFLGAPPPIVPTISASAHGASLGVAWRFP